MYSLNVTPGIGAISTAPFVLAWYDLGFFLDSGSLGPR